MRKLLSALGLLLCAILPAWAQTSSINPALPANGQPYSASVVRGNFDAAATDVNRLMSLNVGSSAPFGCTLAAVGNVWLNNSTSPYTLNYCDGAGTWIAGAFWDPTNHIISPPTGRGACQTIVAATTTDLGTVPQSCITITGNSGVSITSFGSTAKAGDIKIVAFSGINTLIYNATSLILPSAANFTSSASAVCLVEALGSGNWQGLICSSPSGVGATVFSPPGSGVGFRASLSSPATSVVIGVDGFVVCSSLTNASCTELGSYSQTFSGGTTGAGGMDTGSLPATGTVALYAIYNAVTPSTSILGCSMAESGCGGTIYNGGHMPVGYTQSGLLARWPTNGSPALVAFSIGGGRTPPNYVYAATPSDPSATTSTTGVMMGLAGAFTPTNTGRVLFIVTGDYQSSVPLTDGVTMGIRYGTGAAPANGAAPAGTNCGAANGQTNGSGYQMPFAVQCEVVNLTVGTPYWFDIALQALVGGTATTKHIVATAVEN